MTSRKQELSDRILALHEQLVAVRRRLVADDWPSLELTFPQLRVLMALSHAPSRMSDLADTLGNQYSSMTAIVDRLVAKGLVERSDDPKDRRVVLCSLTPDGRALLEKFSSVDQVRLKEISESLTVDEMECVARSFEILLRATNRMAASVAAGQPV